MKRLAWFTPVWPSPPAVPSHSADMLAQLQKRYAIDLFVEPAPVFLDGGQSRTFSAHDFVWKQVREPYDLTVFELADSLAHDFIWPYLLRYPGLVVLLLVTTVNFPFVATENRTPLWLAGSALCSTMLAKPTARKRGRRCTDGRQGCC